MRRRTAAAALAIGLAYTAQATAQERRGAVYVSGGVAAPSQDGVSGDTGGQTYVSAPGGTTLGWTVAAGVFVVPQLSLEAEFSTTGTMRAREPSRYGMTFNEERRDRFLWGAARFHIPALRLLDLEPIVGLGLVSTTKQSRTEHAPLPGGFGSAYSDPQVNETVPARPAVAFGVDARLGTGHVAFVPAFRLVMAGAYPDFPTYYPGGVSRVTLGAGIAIRATF